jgi:hypothetical protein
MLPMASIQKHGNKWRVQVYVAGVRDSTTKPTRQEAAQCALEREAELKGTKLPDRTLLDALRRFADEESSKRSGEKWEVQAGRVDEPWILLAVLRVDQPLAVPSHGDQAP